jgi:hypothetical protein
MNFLDTYPDILTVDDIAEILKVKVNTVYRLYGLVKIRIGKGRGLIRYRKSDLINYIKSKEEEVNIVNANQKKERHWKVGVSTLLPRKELQKLCMEYEGRGTEGGRGLSRKA